jgi:hypothetical protein
MSVETVFPVPLALLLAAFFGFFALLAAVAHASPPQPILREWMRGFSV